MPDRRPRHLVAASRLRLGGRERGMSLVVAFQDCVQT